MSATRAADREAMPGLEGARLRLPALGSQLLTLRRVEPSPCAVACPAGINVKSYVSLIAEGRFAEALEVVRERCPLPGVCGRICHHPCEAACRRAEVDQPVAIRALKRFVADLELELPAPEPPPPPHRLDRVAVIGSGPAGLTAAYDLRLAGYPVTVFEAAAEAGGMLRYGIADYRLPTEVLDREIAVLERAGVEIRTGHRIASPAELEDLLGGFSAALFAVGAQRGRRLGLAGEDGCPQVEDALSFLRRVNRGERAAVGGRVLVIGGGSTAIEAARAARRLAAESVEIVYRRRRAEMPADEEEIEMALAEGIGLRLLAAPSRLVLRAGKLAGLECLEVALGEPDASGRRRPLPIPGSEFVIDADRIFAAIGQETVLDFLPDAVARRVADRGLLRVEPETAMTDLHGVFAAGDVVSGPATVIDAIASGHRAAEAIGRFLESGAPSTAGETAPFGSRLAPEYEIPSPAPPPAERRRPLHAGMLPGREFEEVELAFAPEVAMAEAGRCMRCGPCGECRICAPSCGRRHLTLRLAGEEAGAPEGAALLRAPASFVEVAGSRGAGAAARLMTAAGAAPEPGCPPWDGLEIELTPHRAWIDPDGCRGCARCLEVCAFDAIELLAPRAAETTARIEPSLCRGCNLCVAVCPTGAVISSSVAPGWWGTRWSDLYPELVASAAGPAWVALACQRRIDVVGEALAARPIGSPEVRLVPVRCAGQIDAGALLELYRHGAAGILVAGCPSGSCRYGAGPRLAAEQLSRTRKLLEILGADPDRVVADWAGEGDAPEELPIPAAAASAFAGRRSGTRKGMEA